MTPADSVTLYLGGCTWNRAPLEFYRHFRRSVGEADLEPALRAALAIPNVGGHADVAEACRIGLTEGAARFRAFAGTAEVLRSAPKAAEDPAPGRIESSYRLAKLIIGEARGTEDPAYLLVLRDMAYAARGATDPCVAEGRFTNLFADVSLAISDRDRSPAWSHEQLEHLAAKARELRDDNLDETFSAADTVRGKFTVLYSDLMRTASGGRRALLLAFCEKAVELQHAGRLHPLQAAELLLPLVEYEDLVADEAAHPVLMAITRLAKRGVMNKGSVPGLWSAFAEAVQAAERPDNAQGG